MMCGLMIKLLTQRIILKTPNFSFMFGEVPEEFRDDDVYFISRDGDQFYFQLSMNDDGDLVLEDSCGRHVPVDQEFIKKLGVGIWAAQEVLNAHSRVEELLDNEYRKIHQLVEHFNSEDV